MLAQIMIAEFSGNKTDWCFLHFPILFNEATYNKKGDETHIESLLLHQLVLLAAHGSI